MACKKPCRECPWRKTSPPGYMGGNDIVEYGNAVRTDDRVPCHLLVDSGSFDDVKLDEVCVGLTLARINSCKHVDDPGLIQLHMQYKDSPERKHVFTFAQQFIEYHES